jgi:hypothetical protein
MALGVICNCLCYRFAEISRDRIPFGDENNAQNPAAESSVALLHLFLAAVKPLNLLTGVIRDRFGHIERGIFAAHVIRAHLAFFDHARDRGFEARCALRFIEPVEHELCC